MKYSKCHIKIIFQLDFLTLKKKTENWKVFISQLALLRAPEHSKEACVKLMIVSNFKMVVYKLIQCMYCTCNFYVVQCPCFKLETDTSIWQDVFSIHYTGKIQMEYNAFVFIVFTHIFSTLRRLQKALFEILVMEFLFNILKIR